MNTDDPPYSEKNPRQFFRQLLKNPNVQPSQNRQNSSPIVVQLPSRLNFPNNNTSFQNGNKASSNDSLESMTRMLFDPVNPRTETRNVSNYQNNFSINNYDKDSVDNNSTDVDENYSSNINKIIPNGFNHSSSLKTNNIQHSNNFPNSHKQNFPASNRDLQDRNKNYESDIAHSYSSDDLLSLDYRNSHLLRTTQKNRIYTPRYPHNLSQYSSNDEGNLYNYNPKSSTKSHKIFGPGAFPKTNLRYSQRRKNPELEQNMNFNSRNYNPSPTEILYRRLSKGDKRTTSHQNHAFSDSDYFNKDQHQMPSKSKDQINSFSYSFRNSLAYFTSKFSFVFLLIFYVLKDFLYILLKYTIGYILPFLFIETNKNAPQTPRTRRKNFTTISTGIIVLIVSLFLVANQFNFYSSIINNDKPIKSDRLKNSSSILSNSWISLGNLKNVVFYPFQKYYETSRLSDLANDSLNNFENIISESSFKDLRNKVNRLIDEAILNEKRNKNIENKINKISEMASDHERQIEKFQNTYSHAALINSHAFKNKVLDLINPLIKRETEKIVKSLKTKAHSSHSSTIDEADLDKKIQVLQNRLIGMVNNAISQSGEKIIRNEEEGNVVDFDQVNQLVIKAIEKNTKNRPKRVDYALYSAGGRIILKSTSKSWSPKPKSISARILYKLGVLEYPVNPPSVILDPSVNLGECWPMQGSKGEIGISLARPIEPLGFSIEHVPKSTAIDFKSAPKDFEVWGYVIIKDKKERLKKEMNQQDSNLDSSQKLDKDKQKGQVEEDDDEDDEEFDKKVQFSDGGMDNLAGPIILNKMNEGNFEKKAEHSVYKDGELVKLGTFRYEPSDSEARQEFMIEKLGEGVRVKRILVKILSNWGNKEHTCIYRFSAF
ncbi:SUN domain-containing protein 2 [Smittium culicis]|uniref:SUN domain-containing protein 2 n=1 Tax=Smittium culicis TaxID=133412 RepID=A0A1R1XTC5_9FUNG|nr:SUN domain-containing protein 2 [Smittium culicis]